MAAMLRIKLARDYPTNVPASPYRPQDEKQEHATIGWSRNDPRGCLRQRTRGLGACQQRLVQQIEVAKISDTIEIQSAMRVLLVN